MQHNLQVTSRFGLSRSVKQEQVEKFFLVSADTLTLVLKNERTFNINLNDFDKVNKDKIRAWVRNLMSASTIVKVR